MSRADFWSMHPREFWWIAEAVRPRKTYGTMTEDEVAALYEDAYGEDDE